MTKGQTPYMLLSITEIVSLHIQKRTDNSTRWCPGDRKCSLELRFLPPFWTFSHPATCNVQMVRWTKHENVGRQGSSINMHAQSNTATTGDICIYIYMWYEHTYTHIYIYVYICIYINIYIIWDKWTQTLDRNTTNPREPQATWERQQFCCTPQLEQLLGNISQKLAYTRDRNRQPSFPGPPAGHDI